MLQLPNHLCMCQLCYFLSCALQKLMEKEILGFYLGHNDVDKTWR